MSEQHARKWPKVFLICLGMLLLAIAGGALWLSQNYKRLFREKLPGVVAKGTDSLYQASAGDLDVDLPNRNLVLTDLELQPDPAHVALLRRDFNLPGVILSIHIKRLEVKGYSIGQLAKHQIMDCDTILVESPVVHISKLNRDPAEKTDTAQAGPKIKTILAKQLLIINPDLSFTDQAGKSKATYLAKGGGIQLSDWRFDLADSTIDTSRFLYARRGRVQLGSFNIADPAAQYRISTGAIQFDNTSGNLSLAGVSIKPALSKAEFYRITGYQKEIYDVTFPQLSLSGLDWRSLMQGRGLFAKGGQLSNAAINIYMDRVPPPNPYSKDGKFPNQLLARLKLPVSLPLLEIRNGRFAYTERNQKTKLEGTVAMSGIRGRVTNVTNVPAQVRRNSTCAIHMNGDFKGSPIDATFRFVLGSARGQFSIAGSLGAMDGTRLNDLLRPLALAELRTLNLQGVDFQLSGNEAGASGDLTMRYTDLKANLLKPEDGGLDKNNLMSFLANNLLTFPANPMPGKEVRVAHPTVERDELKSYFNLVWKTLFNGMLQTASRKLIKIDKMVDKKARKQEQKRLEEEPPNPQKKRRR